MADTDLKYTLNADGTVDITAKQGATWDIEMQLQKEDLSPFDLTGWLFRGQVRKVCTSTTVIADFEFPASDLAAGTVRAVLPAAATAAIPCKDKLTENAFVYDMERYQGDPEVVRKDLPRGRLYVIPEVTRQ